MNAAERRERDLLLVFDVLRGSTISAVAEKNGVPYSTVFNAMRRLGVATSGFDRSLPSTGRAELMRDMYESGNTLAEIGVAYSVSRERVRQILRRQFGFTKENGGAKVVAIKKIFTKADRAIEAQKNRAARAEELCGCSIDIILSLGNGYFPWIARSKAPSSPLGRYIEHRQNAKTRGIAWELSLSDWWSIWCASGKWDQRGRGPGYAMARIGDSGPYAVGNVEIITNAQNSADSYIVKPAAERAKKGAATRALKKLSEQQAPA